MQFQEQLLDEFYDADQAIRKQERKQKSLNDPKLAGEIADMDEVVEDHLEEIMLSSAVHEQVQLVGEKKQETDAMHAHAKQMTLEMRGKAEAQRTKHLKDQKKLKDASLVSMMFGQGRDALVLKFILKLK